MDNVQKIAHFLGKIVCKMSCRWRDKKIDACMAFSMTRVLSLQMLWAWHSLVVEHDDDEGVVVTSCAVATTVVALHDAGEWARLFDDVTVVVTPCVVVTS